MNENIYEMQVANKHTMQGDWPRPDETTASPPKKRRLEDTESMGCHLLSLFAIGAHSLLGEQHMNIALDENSENGKKAFEAMNLDHYYARLICGAAVSTNIKFVWVPGSLDGPDEQDMTNLKAIMWHSIAKCIDQMLDSMNIDVATGTRPSTNRGGGNALRGTNTNDRSNFHDPSRVLEEQTDLYRQLQSFVKKFKTCIEDEWAAKKEFRISDCVHMVEMEIVRRLQRDGLLQRISCNDIGTTLRICLIFRRNASLRYPFAAAVGKRLFSTRIVASQRAQIIEHKRASTWAEQAYHALYIFMKDGGSATFAKTFTELVGTGDDAPQDPHNPLINDYINLLNSRRLEAPVDTKTESESEQTSTQQTTGSSFTAARKKLLSMIHGKK